MDRRLLVVMATLALGSCKDAPPSGAAGPGPASSNDPALSALLASPPPPPPRPPDPCGDAPLDPCPLKQWMKANTARAMNARDFDALQATLQRVAKLAPPENYPNWSSIALDGADAARVQDLEAVRAACRGCHTQYRDRYKRELRARPVAA